MGARVLQRLQMNWNDSYHSLGLAIWAATRYSASPYSLEEVLFYTGQGFKINMDRNVGPMDVLGDGSVLKKSLSVLGFDASLLTANICGSPWDDEAPSRGIAMIRESIDRGIPAICWNLVNAEFGLAYGYDDERSILHVHDISAQQGGEISYGEFGRRPLNGQPFDPLVFVLILRDQDNKPHLHPTRYSPENDASYRATLGAALDIIVAHMEDREPRIGGNKNGIAAIDEWIEAFRAGTVHPFFITYNLLWIVSSRKYVLNQFILSSTTFCFAIQDHILQRFMLEAADVFLDGYRKWVELHQLFPFPKGADPNDPTAKEEAIRLLTAARQAELAGLEVLKAIQGHLK